MTEKLTDKLLRIDKFCAEIGLDYAITGTCALQLLGVKVTGHDPQDIDIRVFNPNPRHISHLHSMQTLTKEERPCEYKDSECFDIMLGDTKLNAIICEGSVYMEDYVPVALLNDKTVLVHKVMPALYAKLRLNRPKDNNFLLDFMQTVMSYRI